MVCLMEKCDGNKTILIFMRFLYFFTRYALFRYISMGCRNAKRVTKMRNEAMSNACSIFIRLRYAFRIIFKNKIHRGIYHSIKLKTMRNAKRETFCPKKDAQILIQLVSHFISR